MLSLPTAPSYIALCMLSYLQYELEAKGKEVLSAERIMACISEPVVAGKYPDVALMPTNLSEDFLMLADFLGFRKLEKTMSTTRFQSITKLDLNPQLSIVV
ncbi:MAG: hypothetical protein IJ836_04230 [Spirochaetales bacterium]|nr:hypothetical protein [Spirochaetales bacterium]